MGKRRHRRQVDTSSETSSSSSNDEEPRSKRTFGNTRRTPSPLPPVDTNTDKQRIAQLEKMVRDLQQQNRSVPLASTPRPFLIKTDVVPEFSPGNPNLTCEKWIQKVHERTMTFYSISRLAGLARTWYNNLDATTYEMTWVEWKELLLRTFPAHYDYATLLRKTMNRVKEDKGRGLSTISAS